MNQRQKDIAFMIEHTDPFDLVLRGVTIRAAITHQSGGVYNLQAGTTAGAQENKTLYLLTAGDNDIREYDQFVKDDRTYSIGPVSKTKFSGVVVQTQALLIDNGVLDE
ncbi:hypothetical protein AGMMS49940_15280 [Spirochaetia bacterium]|nr:hypothetical protein AGMMS49940_15280 [Spirochaetia bacterium]